MARPRSSRTIFDPPKFKGYQPHGYAAQDKEPVSLVFEEYTALKLCDYELQTQKQAANAMNISRPTFTRLYESARRKIAEALAEARAIEVEKGDAWSDSAWFHCRACNVFFNNPADKFNSKECPICHSLKIEGVSRTK